MSENIKDVHPTQTQIKASLDLEEPSEELLEWAKENIKENPDTKDLLISDLRDMIYEKGECTPTRTDDKFLLKFLRARKFSVNAAHTLYVNHHNFMEEAPEYFKTVNLKTLSEIKMTNIYNCPVNWDQHGRRMFIFNIGEWSPSEFSPTELLQCLVFLMQLGLLEQKSQIKGTVAIIDLSGLSLEMVWFMTPTLARHMINIAANAMPLRLEAVHFLYSSWMFDTAYNMMKVFISPKNRDRIVFHNELDTLYNHIDPKYLPKSLGGAQENYSLEKWYDSILQSDNAQIKNELEQLGYPVKEFLEAENKSK